MGKCSLCGERKGNRVCLGLKSGICSLCCGTKREKEIPCLPACEYLGKGTAYQLGREITKKISSDLASESGDVFQMDEVADFVLPIERFFVDEFYRDKGINDNHIYQSLAKIYAFQTGVVPTLDAGNHTEKLIFEKFTDVNRRSDLLNSLKARAILRLIKSINSSSGGVLGNRNYLEMIYSQHTGNGKWTDLFLEMESKGR